MPLTDYATPPGTGTVVYTEDQLNAELALNPIAGRLMMFSSPKMPALKLVMLTGYVLLGLWIRGYLVPHGQDAAVACAGLLILVLLRPRSLQSAGKQEPGWARAAAVHEQFLPGRFPAPNYALVKSFTARMTAGTRWRSAHLYVPRCVQKDPSKVHYGACCAGGTYPKQGRLLVILGEHLLCGMPEAGVAILAHERRHCTPRRLHLYSLASVAGTWGLALAGWAVPWPLLLPAAAAVHLSAVLLLWAVEVSCDVGAARETSAGAMIESLDYKQRTREGSRALWPAPLRRTVNVLTWVTGPEHPPYAMRRAAIRAWGR
jgi:hypothetical protein